jgi:tRNA threonylcarbamoyladenosine biosynthesis protein TsaB
VLALGIDTATPVVSVALVDEDQVLSRRDLPANNAHGEVLATLISAVLQEAGTTSTALAAIGVGLGPGPFTGLRVGIVTAASMSDALGIPAYGMCSLDVVVPEEAVQGQPFAVVTDARRRQVYWAVYDAVGARVEGPEIAPPADVAAALRGRLATVVGAGATQYADAFTGFGIADAQGPDAARLAMHAVQELHAGRPSDSLAPLYLRRPDALEPGPPKRVSPA